MLSMLINAFILKILLDLSQIQYATVNISLGPYLPEYSFSCDIISVR